VLVDGASDQLLAGAALAGRAVGVGLEQDRGTVAGVGLVSAWTDELAKPAAARRSAESLPYSLGSSGILLIGSEGKQIPATLQLQ
jgi:hypothetical protein